MQAVLPHRLIEASALLPFLHAKRGRLTVGAVGVLDDRMGPHVLQWRDTEKLILTRKLPINDNRVEVVQQLPDGKLDLLLLSPEQNPQLFLKALAPGGVIQATSADPKRLIQFKDFLKQNLGNAIPWREYLPTPLYGVMAKNSAEKPVRERNPPPSTKRITKQYLPCLFTFGKDEIGIIQNQSDDIPKELHGGFLP